MEAAMSDQTLGAMLMEEIRERAAKTQTKGEKTGFGRKLRKIIDRDGARCWLCGNPIDISFGPHHAMAPSRDHVVPISRGGSNAPENIRLAHRRCNNARGNQP